MPFPNLPIAHVTATNLRSLPAALLAAALLALASPPAPGNEPVPPPEPAAAGEQATGVPETPAPTDGPAIIAGEKAAAATPDGEAATATALPAAASPAQRAAPAPDAESPPGEAAKIAPSRAPRPRWVPLDVGNQWTYIYLRERERSIGGTEPQLESFRGTLVEEVIGNVPEYSPRAVELHSTVRGKVEGSGTETVEQLRAFVESNGFNYRVLAIEAEDPVVGQVEFTRFTPPLLTLKAGARVGEKWRIGSKETAGLMTDLEGEILGVQDAEVPSGVFEKCLVVRYTGSFSGSIEVSGNPIDVQSGQIVSTEWFAPGVGKVLAKEEISESMVLADGSTLDYTERTQFALSSRKSGIQVEDHGG